MDAAWSPRRGGAAALRRGGKMQGMARSHSAPETVQDHSRVMVVIGPSCNQRPPTHAAQSFGCQSAASHSHGAVFLQPPAAIGGFQPTWRKVPATVQSAASHPHGPAWEGLRLLQPGSLAPVPQHQYQPPSMAMGAHLPMQIRMELDILSQAKRLPGIRQQRWCRDHSGT